MVIIMADLPGPKMRIGQLSEEPIELKRGDAFTLTTVQVTGDHLRAFVSLPRLPAVVKACDILFLNDGIIQLEAATGRWQRRPVSGARRGQVAFTNPGSRADPAVR